MQSLLEGSFKAIDEVLSDSSVSSENDILVALILCECRILFKSHEMVTWVEEQFKLFFKETHENLKQKSD